MHVTEMGLTLLAQAQIPIDFWLEAFQIATYLINRLPTHVLDNQSPFQILLNKKLEYHMLHPFGCTTYPCLTPYNQNKLQFHSLKCAFLGYTTSHKGYKCLSPQGQVYIFRHVIFGDSEFPYKSLFISDLQQDQNSEQQNQFPM